MLTDFCNECGNCVTACPTSGRPYRDKPRLYLNRAEFEAETENAFLFERHGDDTVILARFDGATHRMSINGSIDYVAPNVAATFDETFALVSAEAGDGAVAGSAVSLDAAATMFALWRGLSSSMPHVPFASDGGTRVAAPAFDG